MSKAKLGYGTRIKMPNNLELIVLSPWSWEGDNEEFQEDWDSVTVFLVAPLVPAGCGDVAVFADADAVLSHIASLERELLERGTVVETSDALVAAADAMACLRSFFGIGSEEDEQILEARMRVTRHTADVQRSVELLVAYC